MSVQGGEGGQEEFFPSDVMLDCHSFYFSLNYMDFVIAFDRFEFWYSLSKQKKKRERQDRQSYQE